MLEDLGVLDQIDAIGGKYQPQREYADDGSYQVMLVMEPVTPTSDEPYHILLLVPLFLTERVLRERLLKVDGAVTFGCELAAFERDA